MGYATSEVIEPLKVERIREWMEDPYITRCLQRRVRRGLKKGLGLNDNGTRPFTKYWQRDRIESSIMGDPWKIMDYI